MRTIHLPPEQQKISKCIKEHVLVHTTKASSAIIDRSMLAKFGWELVNGLGKVPSNIGQQRQ